MERKKLRDTQEQAFMVGLGRALTGAVKVRDRQSAGSADGAVAKTRDERSGNNSSSGAIEPR